MIRNRVDIISLGCSKNLVDSEKVMAMFAEKGFKFKMAKNMQNGSENAQKQTVEILKNKLPEDKKKQLSSILKDKSALERLLKSSQAQELIKRLKNSK